MEIYFVYSTKLSAWWGKSGIWESALTSAKPFSKEDAINFCRKRYSSTSGLDTIPVSEVDVAAVMKK